VSAVNQVVLSLGSNLGDRVANLQHALDSLIESDVLTDATFSSIYETEPVGGPEQDPYLNAVVRGVTPLEPEHLLTAVHRIENQLGRVREVHWGPRTVDIDILAYNNLALETPDLVIPHPRAHERAFVLIPWNELDAQFVIAGHGTVQECLADVSRDGVELYSGVQLYVRNGGSE
jgi:2-amino-4-hydroxy-6-hydroxymethyldihydropteridine diphosphokinase